ncbi:Ankyrin repeat-containing domain protein [Elaphomyces granulatus]
MSLSDLPTELLIEIATHLDAAGVNALTCTNRDVYNLLNNSLYCRDLTQSDSQSRSLTWGAENGVQGTIQRAVDAAKRFNPIPESFHIALQVAAKRGHVPIVELLLKVHGIDPNFRGGSLKAGPLHLAAEEGHNAIVELLLAVANILIRMKGHVSIVEQLLARDDVDFNARGEYYGSTPLIGACRTGHIEIINLLLAKDGIDINLAHGTTPLVAVAEKRLVEVVESFLRVARDNLNPNIVDSNGYFVLGRAAYVDVMKLLLDRPDVDPNLAWAQLGKICKAPPGARSRRQYFRQRKDCAPMGTL